MDLYNTCHNILHTFTQSETLRNNQYDGIVIGFYTLNLHLFLEIIFVYTCESFT